MCWGNCRNIIPQFPLSVHPNFWGIISWESSYYFRSVQTLVHVLLIEYEEITRMIIDEFAVRGILGPDDDDEYDDYEDDDNDDYDYEDDDDDYDYDDDEE